MPEKHVWSMLVEKTALACRRLAQVESGLSGACRDDLCDFAGLVDHHVVFEDGM